MQTQTIHYIPPVIQAATKLKVAAYARVSSDSADQLDSYAAQVERYGQLIRQNPNWELVDIYADEGLTGTRADTREDFQRLLKDCRQGRIDKVLVKSISRFARNSRDCLLYIRELKTLGVSVLFEKERIDTVDMGSEMMLSFYGAAAQEESLSISGNMRWSYQRRMKSGEFITQFAPYGYQLVKGELVIDQAEAPIVQRIFQEFLSGVSATDIARRLAKESVAKHGGHWTTTAIYPILNNEKYAGNVLLQKSYMTDGLPFRKKMNHGERTKYYVENSHPAIISQDSFDRAQALIRQRNTTIIPGKYPFSLKIICGHCGSTFKRRVTNDKTYWVCRNHDLAKDNCPVGRVPEPVLEQAFLRLHHKLCTHHRDILSPMLEQLQALQKRSAFGQNRMAEIDNEILSLGRQTMILHRLHGAGHMEAAHYYEQSQSINAQVNTLRRERRHLLEGNPEDVLIDQTAHLLELLKENHQQQDSFDSELFSSMVQRITVTSSGQARFVLINSLEVTETL